MSGDAHMAAIQNMKRTRGADVQQGFAVDIL